jgi:hypothetical protein
LYLEDDYEDMDIQAKELISDDDEKGSGSTSSINSHMTARKLGRGSPFFPQPERVIPLNRSPTSTDKQKYSSRNMTDELFEQHQAIIEAQNAELEEWWSQAEAEPERDYEIAELEEPSSQAQAGAERDYEESHREDDEGEA